jgi:hypothetical protein
MRFLILGAALLLTACGGGSAGPGVQTIGFGTGGSGCTLTGAASSFPLGATIRDVVTFTPPLAVGTTIATSIHQGSTELVDRRETLKVEEPAGCMQGVLSPLDVGHYRVTVEIAPSSVPPISGEFDVTPS